jgi:hypothetical protein
MNIKQALKRDTLLVKLKCYGKFIGAFYYYDDMYPFTKDFLINKFG